MESGQHGPTNERTQTVEHTAQVNERSNGALWVDCTCGWEWGYDTDSEWLAEDAVVAHENECCVEE